ncbi:MAG: hypothetical protein FJX95_10020, partial [Bacteroidetes bacterium]|nr:hypothetical protein [Bacteroidota bacterium]
RPPVRRGQQVKKGRVGHQKGIQNASWINTFFNVWAVMVHAITAKNSNRPFIKIKINGSESNFLFDSGAETSLMSTQNFRKIPISKRPAKVNEEYAHFSAANGKPLKVVGTYMVDMVIGQHKIQQKIRVCDDLREVNILGVDAIRKFGLNYHAKSNRLYFDEPAPNDIAPILAAQATTLPPFQVKNVKIKLTEEMAQQGVCLASVGAHKHPLVVFEPGLIDCNKRENFVTLYNSSPAEVTIDRNDQIGIVEKLDVNKIHPIHYDILSVNSKIQAKSETTPQLTKEREREILSQLNINIDNDNEKREYKKLVLEFHDIFSRNKTDLGRCNHYEHKIEMKNKQPVYTKQFKLPLAHQKFLEEQIKDWLRIGIIQKSRSLYNSPVFLVEKKDKTYRTVCDYRMTNAHSLPDLYSQRDVIECINEIGQQNSNIFSTFDLTSGFWQLPLHPDSRKYTAFTVPSMQQQFE